MKHNILNSAMFLAMAALTFTACSSSEDATSEGNVPPVNDQTAINFGAYMNRSTTRGGWAGELTTEKLGGALPEGAGGFGVLAYYTDNQPYTPTALPNFMYNQNVAKSGENWVYAPLKYWPNEFGANAESKGIDYLSFFAYAPYTEVNLTTGTAVTNDKEGIIGMTRGAENGSPKVRYCTSFDPANQVDLCWAAPWINRTKDLYTISSTVDFTFKHALAAINVQIDAAVDEMAPGQKTLDPNTRIWVRKVEFDGLAIKGDLDLNNNQDNPLWYEIYTNNSLAGEPVVIHDGRRDGSEGYAAMPNEQPIAINEILVQGDKYDTNAGFSSTTNGVTNTAVNLFKSNTPTDPIYVIPTDLPLRVTITYDVETYDPNLVSKYLSDKETHGSTIENCISKEIGVTLAAGKKYTIGLHLGMTSVKTTATVTNWAPGDNTDTDLPANNN